MLSPTVRQALDAKHTRNGGSQPATLPPFLVQRATVEVAKMQQEARKLRRRMKRREQAAELIAWLVVGSGWLLLARYVLPAMIGGEV